MAQRTAFQNVDVEQQGSNVEPICLRVPDACRFIGVSRSTLYVLIADREVEVVKLGSSTLVLVESLRRLIEACRLKSVGAIN
ncbi:hypothetical protein ASE85_16885 [Sphingobium sp. Leaf26]|uniref:helix-turn-helix domain-containing protein n=1 Tax=Sphingobium sp. Leaf26 TaxID=1735693 RepID=UPI0006F52D2C|nr:helix-turn-helix domain-containing protein [Sphingobium sp. Leaf26]KQN08663.1 hypothetical protein ASE85_16885 [Sphingobium sp. Leaf26]